MNPKPTQEEDDRRVRAHVWIKGRVQGVGFRAHVEYHARQIGELTGWVRNVGYDTVEAIAEGERPKVELFIEKVKEGPRASRVDESKVEWEDVTGEFREFGVKRSM
jgi:acylphosphatase